MDQTPEMKPLCDVKMESPTNTNIAFNCDAVLQSLIDIKVESTDDSTKPIIHAVAGTSNASQCENAPQRRTAMPNIKVHIVNEPNPDGVRFRYKSEGRNSELRGKLPDSYVTIRLSGPDIGLYTYVAVISCVDHIAPHRPHPHKLTGSVYEKDYGALVIDFDGNEPLLLKDVTIQCVKKSPAQISESLRKRQEKNIDPFKTTFANQANFNMDVVRLGVQVLCTNAIGGRPIMLKPVVTEPVRDKKSIEKLIIVSLSQCSGPAGGGQQLMLLCEKVNANNIAVLFNEVVDGNECRMAEATIGSVHKQYAITFTTPSYREPNTPCNVTCRMRLFNKDSQNYSDFVTYEYVAAQHEPAIRHRKRPRIQQFYSDVANIGVQSGLPVFGVAFQDTGCTIPALSPESNALQKDVAPVGRRANGFSHQFTSLMNQDLSTEDPQIGDFVAGINADLQFPQQSPIMADVLSVILDKTTLDEYLPS